MHYLTLDRTARYPFHVVALHTHKQRYDYTAHDERACTKYREIVVKAVFFRVYHFI